LAPIPLARWVDVSRVGPRGAEVAWNLDDTRPGSPGRLALYAGLEPPPPRELPGAEGESRAGVAVRRAPLPEAQESLRPVTELTWADGGLHLRLTAQGPWDLEALLALAASV